MVIVRAPVRVSFGGGGTDLAAYYAHFGGLLVSTAITRYCSAVVCPSVDGSIRIHSADYRTWEMYPRGEIPQVEGILSLPKAAIARFADLGLRKKGVDLYLFSEVPPGSGLGSSSAMAVALVRALAAHLGLLLSAMEVAELACSLEIELLRMPIGKQDQYASACVFAKQPAALLYRTDAQFGQRSRSTAPGYADEAGGYSFPASDQAAGVRDARGAAGREPGAFRTAA